MKELYLDKSTSVYYQVEKLPCEAYRWKNLTT